MAYFVRFAVPATLVAVVVACSSSSNTPAPDYAGSCEILGKQCHGVGTALADECHDLGHAGDDSKCGPRKAECLAACPEDAHGDGGHGDTDAGSDASTDAPNADASDGAVDGCIAYCECMKSACDVTDEAACKTTCAGFSAADLECFGDHCEAAKTAADPAHDCQHASGEVACH
jgi:hypothetical protein